MMQAENLTKLIDGQTLTHACAVEVDGIGILIEGASGSGKTSVAFGLMDVAAARRQSAYLVSDDQVLLQADGNTLTAHAPDTIFAKAELRGFGIIDLPSERLKPQTQIRAVARLIEDSEIERMPEPETCERLGVTLSLAHCPKRHEAQAIRIILALTEQLAR